MDRHTNIIIIPYRNRLTQIERYIEKVVPLLEQCLPNSKVVVVEQNEGKLFNRGALLNIAFKEYHDKTTYFITQDVDIYPTQKCIEEYYAKEVDHILGIYSPFHTLGGIVKLKDSDVHTINGFPNDIWGWGGEDNVLRNRANFYDIKESKDFIMDYDNSVLPDPKYFERLDDIDDRNKINWRKHQQFHDYVFPHMKKEDKLKDILSSGLNTLHYSIIERKYIHPIVEWMKVDI